MAYYATMGRQRLYRLAARKLPPKVKQKMVERLGLFAQDPTNKQLRNHALYSSFSGSCGIGTTGDYRAIYELVNGETALFTHIGTHSQLYR